MFAKNTLQRNKRFQNYNTFRMNPKDFLKQIFRIFRSKYRQKTSA